jgi:hypothetical protein
LIVADRKASDTFQKLEKELASYFHRILDMGKDSMEIAGQLFLELLKGITCFAVSNYQS